MQIEVTYYKDDKRGPVNEKILKSALETLSNFSKEAVSFRSKSVDNDGDLKTKLAQAAEIVTGAFESKEPLDTLLDISKQAIDNDVGIWYNRWYV